MKNNRIVRAYDSINPSPAEKAKMLDAILAEANMEEKPTRERKKKNTVTYTAKAPKPSKRSNFMAIAASLVLLLISGLVLMQMVRQSDTVSYTQPEEPVNLGTPYDAVLNKYKIALEEGWSVEQCQIEDICAHTTTTNYSALNVGYSILDLDSNGREELVITNGQGLVWDLYTLLEDGTPVHVHNQEDGWPVYRLYENGIICAEDFDAGKVYEYYRYQDGAFTGPELVIRQESGMFTYEPEGEEASFITEAEAEAKMAEYQLQKLDQTSLLSLVSEAVAEKYLYGSNTKYAEIIAKYNQAIAEGWTKEQCEIEGISTRMEAGGDFTKAGYTFLDLDGDGREELIIAEEAVPHYDNIRDIYTTLEDGTPIQLWVDERDGYQGYLYEGNVIGIEYSGKDRGEYVYHTLEKGQLVLKECLMYSDESWVYTTDGTQLTMISPKEATDITYGYEHRKLNLTWLADISDYLRDTESVEGYTPILEKYKTALTEGWTEHLCEENDISPQLFEGLAGYQSPGWCLLDLDSDGVEELIISDGVYLYDLYTMMPDNSGPGHILCANGGETYQLCENGVIEKHGNYSGTSAWRYYTLREIDLVQQDMVFYEGAINQYSYGTWDNDLQAITKEKAGGIIGRDQVMKLELTPFVERPDFWPEDSAQYEPLLNVYRQAVREKWNPGQCMEKGISLMVGYYGEQYDELGYAMRDLDNNGINELIITDGTNIYDLYTLVQQGVEPVQLATAMERVQYFLSTDGRVYCMASGSASVSYYTLYSLEGHELRLLEGYMMDYETDPENPWYYYDDVEKGGPCSTQVATAAIDPIEFEHFTLVYFE